jgi:hypothetical protein
MSGTSQLEAQIAEIEDGIKALRTQIPVDQERIDCGLGSWLNSEQRRHGSTTAKL